MDKSAAVILAGGEGRRLGGMEKALVEISGHRLIDLAISNLERQCKTLALSLRVDQSWAANLQLPVLLDRPTAQVGPLGGVAASLHWAATRAPMPAWVITVPVDLPFLPDELIQRLTANDADIAVACSGGRAHHAVAAWRPHLYDSLTDALKNGAMAIGEFQSQHKVAEVSWSADQTDPFFNVNTPGDVKEAEQRLRDL